MVDQVMMRVRAAPARRALAVGVLYALGGMLSYAALGQETKMGWALVLLVLALLTLLGGEALRRASALGLQLDDSGLSDSSGDVLARWDDIVAVDRGSFSLRPSNGFTLRLRHSGARAWKPGLWWRLGRRVGVGGVTDARPTRALAEAIALRLEQRNPSR